MSYELLYPYNIFPLLPRKSVHKMCTFLYQIYSLAVVGIYYLGGSNNSHVITQSDKRGIPWRWGITEVLYY